MSSSQSIDAFVTSSRCFIASCGKPLSIWSDHGSTFIGVARELRELTQFLELQKAKSLILEYCSTQKNSVEIHPVSHFQIGDIWSQL